jgi:hypothetical protein
MYSGRGAGAPFDPGCCQIFCCTRRGTFIFLVFYVFLRTGYVFVLQIRANKSAACPLVLLQA